MTAKQDLQQFIKFYSANEVSKGLQILFPDPNISLDRFPKDSNSQLLINYADSLTQGNAIEALVANEYLQEHLKFVTKLPKSAEQFLKKLQEDRAFLKLLTLRPDQTDSFLRQGLGADVSQDLLTYLVSEAKRLILSKSSVEQLLKGKSSGLLKTQIDYGQNFVRFELEKSSFCRLLFEADPFMSRTVFPISYAMSKERESDIRNAILNTDKDRIPFLFMDPYQIDWKSLLDPLSKKTACLLFADVPSFLHCLQFDSVLEALIDRQHLILILSRYPNGQIACQPLHRQFLREYTPIFISERKPFTAYSQLILDKIRRVISQSSAEKRGESNEANALYSLGKTIHHTLLYERAGSNRFAAAHTAIESSDWHDPHKASGAIDLVAGPTSHHNLASHLAKLDPIAPKRTYSPKKRIRLAHIVPQMVDIGHAPTKMLRSFLKEHNKSKFWLKVYSTERMYFRPCEYPFDRYCSAHSLERAPLFLKELQESNIPYQLDTGNSSFQKTAENLAQSLQKDHIDIAVFHGPDIINSTCATVCDVPFTVMFEHGTLPSTGSFDLIIASSEASSQKYADFYLAIGSKIEGISFAYDAQESWSAAPFDKREWGLNDKARILTTISNNLEARVGSEMVLAIAQILKKVPSAYYMPMGVLQDEQAFIKRFAEYNVEDRVCPLGQVPNPSHLARSMDLYLNEFPFGSGLAILDAMAAGLPVVSMHNEDGIAQAKYGAAFYGEDRVIKSQDPEEYSALACRLLREDSMYKEWSEEAYKRYEVNSSTSSYIHKIESIIEKHVINS